MQVTMQSFLCPPDEKIFTVASDTGRIVMLHRDAPEKYSRRVHKGPQVDFVTVTVSMLIVTVIRLCIIVIVSVSVIVICATDSYAGWHLQMGYLSTGGDLWKYQWTRLHQIAERAFQALCCTV